MPRPHVRHDGYGRPLPTLSEAQQEGLLDRPFNQAMRRFLLALLEEELQLVCRRGVYARVHLCFDVEDGMLNAEGTEMQTVRRHRFATKDA